MGRTRRLLDPDGVHHVTTRGNEGRAIFSDEHDRALFLRLLGEVVADRGWRIGTFCLMTNHVHLLVRAGGGDLSEGMRDLLSAHARAFNERHARLGHLFAGRFHCQSVRREAHHLEVYRYIALNPVRAGIVTDPAAFRWSAHAALVGAAPVPRFLDVALVPFAGDRSSYAQFVAEGPAFGTLLGDLLRDGAPDRIRLARGAGFSQRAIAAELGLSQATVSRRERE